MNRLSIVMAGLLAISPGVSSGAPYTPVSQMAISCKGNTPFESGMCFGYIMATLDAATADHPVMVTPATAAELQCVSI